MKKNAYLAVHGLLQHFIKRGEPMFRHRTISIFIIAYLAKKGRNHVGWYLFDIKKREPDFSDSLKYASANAYLNSFTIILSIFDKRNS